MKKRKTSGIRLLLREVCNIIVNSLVHVDNILRKVFILTLLFNFLHSMETRRRPNPCVSCNVMVGVFSCQGCKDNFCLDHTCEHRRFLRKSMDDISDNCDELLNTIQGEREKSRSTLMEEIERWEQQSIEKIRQLAVETRKQVSTNIQNDSDHVIEQIEILKQKLDDARQDDGFFENDLKQWEQSLDELQHLCKPGRAMQIIEDNDSNTFISVISLQYRSIQSNGTSGSYDSLRREEFLNNNHDDRPNSHVDRSHKKKPKEYSEGRISLRYKIDRYSEGCDVKLGITSSKKSINSLVSDDLTFYGWTNDNDSVFLGGDKEPNHEGYISDFQAGDVFELVLDCDQRMIQLTNERTNSVHKLDVEINKCPFPWKSHVRVINKTT